MSASRDRGFKGGGTSCCPGGARGDARRCTIPAGLACRRLVTTSRRATGCPVTPDATTRPGATSTSIEPILPRATTNTTDTNEASLPLTKSTSATKPGLRVVTSTVTTSRSAGSAPGMYRSQLPVRSALRKHHGRRRVSLRHGRVHRARPDRERRSHVHPGGKSQSALLFVPNAECAEPGAPHAGVMATDARPGGRRGAGPSMLSRWSVFSSNGTEVGAAQEAFPGARFGVRLAAGRFD
jgi:hypothetical protein